MTFKESGLMVVDIQVLWCSFPTNETRTVLGKISVAVGAHQVRNTNESSQRRHFIEKAIMHERYMNLDNDSNHDIMLLRLNESIQFNRRVRPICVDTTEFEPDAPCYVTGWGTINPNPEST